METTAPFELAQLTSFDKFWVEPSEKVPVAVNCTLVSLAMVALVGEMLRLVSVAEVTCIVPVLLEIPSQDAEIWTEPAPPPSAYPYWLMVSIWGLLELQMTWLVRFCVVPSEKVPMAVNCCVVPLANVAVLGLIAIETRVAGVTVIVCVV